MRVRLAADEQLLPEAGSAGRARRVLRDALPADLRLGRGEVLDAAQLAVSELVTNALTHAGTPMRLRILLASHLLRVELTDGSPRMPHRHDFGPAAATGRGLHLVHELVTRWGAHAVPGGKVVWFEIIDGLPAAALPDPAGTGPDSPAVVVALLRMPLLMHLAWQEHAAALLRELMLIRLEAGLDVLAEHAKASDALGLLLEQVPAPHVGSEPDSVMEHGTEPAASVPRLDLAIPRESLSSFEALDVLLDEALELAEEGQLLLPPTQPEIEAMRRWICDQVRGQAAGRRPVPWRTMSSAPAPPRPPLPRGWGAEEVATSERARLAVDDAGRIVALSRPALDLLGYHEPADLVGNRLLSIMPVRFHQAHVAGFTRFLVDGHGPVLDRQVSVPVVRSDGHEVELALFIRHRTVPGGRYVFTAEFVD